ELCTWLELSRVLFWSSLPADVGAVARAMADINVASLSEHGALRRRAGIDDGTRKPADAQLSQLQDILDRDMRAGAFGMSTGLERSEERRVGKTILVRR